MGRSFPLLDGYRAMAALMILTTHVAFNTGEIRTPVLGPILGRMDFAVTRAYAASTPRSKCDLANSPHRAPEV